MNNRQCALCGTEIALYPCTHALVTDTQVSMSRQEWTRLTAELNQLRTENAQLVEIAEAVAEAGVGDEDGGGTWLMFAGYDAETVRAKARALLAEDGGE